MSDIGGRIRQIRKNLGLSQTDFAEKISVKGPTTVSKYEKNQRSPNLKTFALIAKLGKTTIEWLMTGKQLKPASKNDIDMALGCNTADSESEDKNNLVMVTKYKDGAENDRTGADNYENGKTEQMAFRKDWLIKDMNLDPGKLSIINIVGDSMEPFLIEGDLVLVDHRTTTPKNDGIYIINYDQTLIAKRLQFAPMEIIIISDNPAYEKTTVPRSEQDSLKIIGKVVWLGKKI